jgi:hypothetical protein
MLLRLGLQFEHKALPPQITWADPARPGVSPGAKCRLPHRQQQRAELPVKFELLINMKTWELCSRRRSSLRADVSEGARQAGAISRWKILCRRSRARWYQCGP